MSASHDLNARQLGLLRDLLAPFADSIERVGLFGSRATGNAKRASDIDLVLYGPIEDWQMDRLRTSFEESSLELQVDLVAYQRIDHLPLKRHIDSFGSPLFDRADLSAAATTP